MSIGRIQSMGGGFVNIRESGGGFVNFPESGAGFVNIHESGGGFVNIPESGRWSPWPQYAGRAMVSLPETAGGFVNFPESGGGFVTIPETGKVSETDCIKVWTDLKELGGASGDDQAELCLALTDKAMCDYCLGPNFWTPDGFPTQLAKDIMADAKQDAGESSSGDGWWANVMEGIDKLNEGAMSWYKLVGGDTNGTDGTNGTNGSGTRATSSVNWWLVGGAAVMVGALVWAANR